MTAFYNQKAPKKATNVTINSELLAVAKEKKINLSKLFEASLENELKEKLAKEWEEKNAEAIEHYNETIARRGVFSDGVRRF